MSDDSSELLGERNRKRDWLVDDMASLILEHADRMVRDSLNARQEGDGTALDWLTPTLAVHISTAAVRYAMDEEREEGRELNATLLRSEIASLAGYM